MAATGQRNVYAALVPPKYASAERLSIPCTQAVKGRRHVCVGGCGVVGCFGGVLGLLGGWAVGAVGVVGLMGLVGGNACKVVGVVWVVGLWGCKLWGCFFLIACAMPAST